VFVHQQTDSEIVSENTNNGNEGEKKYNAGETIMSISLTITRGIFFSIKQSDGTYSQFHSSPSGNYLFIHSGFNYFSSKRLENGQIYNGYKLNEKNKIENS